MSNITIRVENYILSRAEGLSKRYRIGAAQHRHDTTSTRLSAGLRDAISNVGSGMWNVLRHRHSPFHIPDSTSSKDLWVLKDVSCEACPFTVFRASSECNRRIQRGEVVGSPSTEFTLSAVEALSAG